VYACAAASKLTSWISSIAVAPAELRAACSAATPPDRPRASPRCAPGAGFNLREAGRIEQHNEPVGPLDVVTQQIAADGRLDGRGPPDFLRLGGDHAGHVVDHEGQNRAGAAGHDNLRHALAEFCERFVPSEQTLYTLTAPGP